MSFLEFLNLSMAEMILGSVLAFVFCINFCSIGKLFFPQKGNVFCCLAGISAAAAIIVITISYMAAAAKYLIVAFLVISTALTIYNFIKREVLIKSYFMSFLPVAIIFAIIVLKECVEYSGVSGEVLWNNHTPYLASIPLEIHKADYFSRIRLIVGYPYEWAKYHFFNGAMTAIPLIFFINKNFVTYMLAKALTISIYLGAFYELIREKENLFKSIALFSVNLGLFLACDPLLTRWSFYTNNYSSLIFAAILFILFMRKDYPAAALMSIDFALACSRSIFVGFFWVLFALSKIYSRKEKWTGFIRKYKREAIYAVITGLACIVMVFSGKSSYGQDVLTFTFVKSFLYGHFNLIPMGDIVNIKSVSTIFVIAVYIYVFIRKRFIEKIIKKPVTTIVVFACICLATAMLYPKAKELGISWTDSVVGFFGLLCIGYIVPLICMFLMFEKEFKVPFYLFLAAQAIMFFTLAWTSTIANYCTLFVPLYMAVAKDLFELNIKRETAKKAAVAVGTIASIVAYLEVNGDWWFFYSSSTIPIESVENENGEFYYYSEADSNRAKLSAYKGDRVVFMVTPDINDPNMRQISEGLIFLPEDYQNIEAQYD